MKSGKIKFVMTWLLFLFGACTTNKETQLTLPGMETREYLFMIHFSSHNCMSCLYHLEALDSLQKVIDANGSNTLVAVAGDSSADFLEVYEYFNTRVPVIKSDRLNEFSFFRKGLTPVVYFVNVKTGHLIFMDKLPEEEYRFNALRDLIYAWSGVVARR